MRELQSALNIIFWLAKAIPITTAYILILRHLYSRVSDWKGSDAARDLASAQALAYALIGLAALLWAVGR